MKRTEALIEKMGRLYPRTHQADCPDKFRAIAEWWWLSSMMSRTREDHRKTARSQHAIALDMERRPRHHASKPSDMTRYQWSKYPLPHPARKVI